MAGPRWPPPVVTAMFRRPSGQMSSSRRQALTCKPNEPHSNPKSCFKVNNWIFILDWKVSALKVKAMAHQPTQLWSWFGSEPVGVCVIYRLTTAFPRGCVYLGGPVAWVWSGEHWHVIVHGIIYDIYYVIMIMNTDYAQIVPWKMALFGRSQCSWHYMWFILCYNERCHGWAWTLTTPR